MAKFETARPLAYTRKREAAPRSIMDDDIPRQGCWASASLERGKPVRFERIRHFTASPLAPCLRLTRLCRLAQSALQLTCEQGRTSARGRSRDARWKLQGRLTRSALATSVTQPQEREATSHAHNCIMPKLDWLADAKRRNTRQRRFGQRDVMLVAVAAGCRHER